MATAQKTISESGSLATKTLVTTISAPGIKQDAEISVSPSIDASKVSYTINEVAGTITVTLTSANYTSSKTEDQTFSHTGTEILPFEEGWVQIYCSYGSHSFYRGKYQVGSTIPDCPLTHTFRVTVYYFNYTITVTYKTFPELSVKVGGQVKQGIDGWVKVGGELKRIVQIWTKVGGQLKES